VHRIFRRLALVLGILLAATVLTVGIYRFVPVPITPLMVIRLVEQWIDARPVRMEKRWTTLDNISPHLLAAVMAAEDQNFLAHYGIDVDAIEQALERNKRLKKLYGASTITQQVAKNVFLWPQRSWARKLFELYFSMLIELLWSKRRILEVYVNVIEWGDGIYGAYQASHFYFHHPLDQLSKEEAALLAAVLPNPRRWRPDHPTDYILKRKAWILKYMPQMRFQLDRLERG
jgi:monofunctional glycosyltransferase